MLRILFVIVNNIYCIPTYLIWMLLLLPLRKLHPNTFYWIEGKLFHWLLANVAMWSYTAGYDSEFYCAHMNTMHLLKPISYSF